ncbi:MAG: hypothetical protein IH899_02060 [Planctomycetes bacterium]|nr:hypothetical protein [Planctomycetota bacterium]
MTFLNLSLRTGDVPKTHFVDHALEEPDTLATGSPLFRADIQVLHPTREIGDPHGHVQEFHPRRYPQTLHCKSCGRSNIASCQTHHCYLT